MKMQEAKEMLFGENSLSKMDPVVVPYSDLVPLEGNVYEVQTNCRLNVKINILVEEKIFDVNKFV